MSFATHEYYWRIGTRIDEWSNYEPHEQRVTPQRAFCKKCYAVLDDWYPKPLEIELQNIDVVRAVSLSCGPSRRSRCKARVIHADVWRQIAHLCPTAAIGNVSIWRGEFLRPADEWVAVRFPPSELVHVRGSYHPQYASPAHGVCSACGRQKYFATHDPHLVRCQIPPDRPVFMDWNDYVIIAEPVARAMDWSGFPDFEYERLPVLDRPLDGLRLLGDPQWPPIGSCYASMHFKTDDVEAVRRSFQRNLRMRDGAKGLVAPAVRGWVNVYPEGWNWSPSDVQFIAEWARVGHAIFFIVRESRVLYYWYVRNGNLADEFFSRANPEVQRDMEATGNPQAFEGLLDEAGRARLGELLGPRSIGDARPGASASFEAEEERLARIAELLGIPGVPGSYDELANGRSIEDVGSMSQMLVVT